MCEGKVVIVKNSEIKESFEEVVCLEVEYHARRVVIKTMEGESREVLGFRRIFCDFVKHVTRIELD